MIDIFNGFLGLSPLDIVTLRPRLKSTLFKVVSNKDILFQNFLRELNYYVNLVDSNISYEYVSPEGRRLAAKVKAGRATEEEIEKLSNMDRQLSRSVNFGEGPYSLNEEEFQVFMKHVENLEQSKTLFDDLNLNGAQGQYVLGYPISNTLQISPFRMIHRVRNSSKNRYRIRKDMEILANGVEESSRKEVSLLYSEFDQLEIRSELRDIFLETYKCLESIKISSGDFINLYKILEYLYSKVQDTKPEVSCSLEDKGWFWDNQYKPLIFSEQCKKLSTVNSSEVLVTSEVKKLAKTSLRLLEDFDKTQLLREVL